MLKIDPKAWKAFWYLFKMQAKILVPIIGGISIIGAVVVGDFSMVVSNIGFALAMSFGFAFSIWIIGMCFDFCMLILIAILALIGTPFRWTAYRYRMRQQQQQARVPDWSAPSAEAAEGAIPASAFPRSEL